MNNNYNEDNIIYDLKKFLFRLYENKFIIIIVILLSLIISYFMSNFYFKPIFKTEVTIKLNNILSSNYSNPRYINEIINSEKFLRQIEKNSNIKSTNIYKKMSIKILLDENNNLFRQFKENTIIKIIMSGNAPEKITQLVNVISKKIVEDANKDVENKINELKKQTDFFKEQIAEINTISEQLDLLLDKNKYKGSLSNLEYKKDLYTKKIELTKSRIDNNKILFDYNDKIDYIKKASILNKAKVPDKSISPNIKLNLLISIILGLFLSIFIVFIKEFIKNTNWKKFKD